MDTDQLTAFDRIVRDGSFTRAARELGIAQPSISARIQALEREVGGALFVRRGRAVALSERGNAFLPYARRLLEIASEGREAALLSEGGQRGRVVAGIIQTIADAYLAPVLMAFQRSHPGVEIAARVGHSDEVVAMVSDGAAHLGFVAWPVFSPEVVSLARWVEPIVPIVAAGNPLIRRGPVTLEEAVASADPLYPIEWDPTTRVLIARLVPHARRVIAAPSTVVRRLLPQGNGVALYVRTLVEKELADGQLVELPVSDLSPLERECALVRLHQHGPLAPAPAAFADAFVAELRARHVRLHISASGDEHARL